MKYSTWVKAVIISAAYLSTQLVHAETLSFECDYPSYSDNEGKHKTKEQFGLRFLIDMDAGKAYVLGNVGSEEVSLIPNDDGLTLVEVTGTGNVMVTAISKTGNSVHSRSGIMFGEIVPSQYYGSSTSK